MSYETPQPSVITAIFQSIAIVLFGVCLYLFCDALQTGRRYDTALAQLQTRKSELRRADRQVDEYMDFLAANPFFTTRTGEPQWEKFSETWEDLPFFPLLQRLSQLYQEEHPFVLDYFTLSTEAAGDTGNTAADSANSQQEQNRGAPEFIIQGYYLCPCQ